MTSEEKRDMLYEKAFQEQERFRTALYQMTPKDILKNAYRYAMQEDILCELDSMELSEERTDALLSSPSPLLDIYAAWVKRDATYMDDIRDTIEYHADEEIRHKQSAEREGR